MLVENKAVSVKADTMANFFLHWFPDRGGIVPREELSVLNNVPMPYGVFTFDFAQYLQYLRDFYVDIDISPVVVRKNGESVKFQCRGLASAETVLELLDNDDEQALKRLFLGELGLALGIATVAYRDVADSFHVWWSGVATDNNEHCIFIGYEDTPATRALYDAEFMGVLDEQIMLLQGTKMNPQLSNAKLASMLYSYYAEPSRAGYPFYDVICI